MAAGRLASGDCRSRIHVWEAAPGGKWAVGGAVKGHEGSVEDLQWSPTEATVFASASADKTVRIWDTREQVGAARHCACRAVGGDVGGCGLPPTPGTPPPQQSRAMLSVAAHDSDVNVISWNHATAYMLASGGDDGCLRVWDLRNFKDGAAVANFAYHRWAGVVAGWLAGGRWLACRRLRQPCRSAAHPAACSSRA